MDHGILMASVGGCITMVNVYLWKSWLASFIVSVSIITNVAGTEMTKFEWQATESAPQNYPMKIISGRLSYYDSTGSLYVPDKSRISHGWGRGVSSHVVGDDLKPLPDKLSITFFSYTENQFYRGEFDLPYKKILRLFQEGFYSPNEGGQETYEVIIVGVAPGGAVSVWLWGYDKITEVFFGQAAKIGGDWSSINTNPKYSREEYIQIGINEALKTPEALAALKKKGVPIGLWGSYRKRYHWQPLFTNMALREKRISLIKYFNGEQDYINYPLEKSVAESTRAIPSYISFVWQPEKGKARLFELEFDEAEIFEAFKKLGGNGEPLKIEMLMERIDGQYIFSVSLRNDKESLKLKKTNLETYAARDYEAEATE